MIVTVATFCICTSVQTQNQLFDFSTGEFIFATEYSDVQGNPYFFTEWPKGDLYNQNGEIYEGFLVNYNMMEGIMEVSDGIYRLPIDPEHFWCITVSKRLNKEVLNLPDSSIFIKGMLPKDDYKFVHMVYNGYRIKMIREPLVDINLKLLGQEKMNYNFKKFIRKDNYYLIIDGNYHSVRKNKGSILDKLKNRDRLEEWIDQNELNFNLDSDFVRLLSYYEKIMS